MTNGVLSKTGGLGFLSGKAYQGVFVLLIRVFRVLLASAITARPQC